VNDQRPTNDQPTRREAAAVPAGTSARPEWHADEQQLAAYLSGQAPRTLTASVEAHLLACARCREAIAAGTDAAATTEAWDRLADAVDRPSPSLLGRLAGHRVARSAVATPALLRAAATAALLLGLVPLLAGLASGDAAVVVLLVLAPLAPVAAVALAYRDWTDPAGEMSLAAPSAGLRLVAMRALAVSLLALPLAVASMVAVEAWAGDVPLRLAAAWVLPGVALASLVLLAGTTRLDPWDVALGLSGGWALAVLATVTARRSLRPEMFVELLAGPAVQAAALAVSVAALTLTVVRRDAVTYRRIA
jgi:hypothetical protein